LGTWGRGLYITAYPRVVHASEFLLAKGTFPATLAVGLRQSHVSPARSGATSKSVGNGFDSRSEQLRKAFLLYGRKQLRRNYDKLRRKKVTT